MGKHSIRANKGIIIIAIIVILVIIAITTFLFKKNQKSINGESIIEGIKIDQTKITSKKTERMLQLEELQKENSDIIGYIEIAGTNISYPVLQTTDNDFYMKKNYKKEYSKDGAIFLDKAYDFNKPSSNLLIYGHNNSNDQMFCELLKYEDENFYNEHQTIRFTTNKEDAEYEIIAVFKSRVYYKSEKNVFRYYYFVDANNKEEFDEFVKSSKKASLYDTGKTAEYGDQLMTLSTCSYHTEDGRFAVVARKKK